MQRNNLFVDKFEDFTPEEAAQILFIEFEYKPCEMLLKRFPELNIYSIQPVLEDWVKNKGVGFKEFGPITDFQEFKRSTGKRKKYIHE